MAIHSADILTGFGLLFLLVSVILVFTDETGYAATFIGLGAVAFIINYFYQRKEATETHSLLDGLKGNPQVSKALTSSSSSLLRSLISAAE